MIKDFVKKKIENAFNSDNPMEFKNFIDEIVEHAVKEYNFKNKEITSSLISGVFNIKIINLADLLDLGFDTEKSELSKVMLSLAELYNIALQNTIKYGIKSAESKKAIKFLLRGSDYFHKQ